MAVNVNNNAVEVLIGLNICFMMPNAIKNMITKVNIPIVVPSIFSITSIIIINDKFDIYYFFILGDS